METGRKNMQLAERGGGWWGRYATQSYSARFREWQNKQQQQQQQQPKNRERCVIPLDVLSDLHCPTPSICSLRHQVVCVIALVVVVVAFSSFCGVFDQSFPACTFLCEISSRTLIPLFYARISPQWLSELRRLWPNTPWRVACEFVSW